MQIYSSISFLLHLIKYLSFIVCAALIYNVEFKSVENSLSLQQQHFINSICNGTARDKTVIIITMPTRFKW